MTPGKERKLGASSDEKGRKLSVSQKLRGAFGNEMSEGVPFKTFNQQEKRDRLDYLWNKLRVAVFTNSQFAQIAKEEKEMDRDNLGLDTDSDEDNTMYKLPDTQVLEEELVYEEDGGFNDLAWYLIDPETNFSQF